MASISLPSGSISLPSGLMVGISFPMGSISTGLETEPLASNVAISGVLQVGQEITGTYDYTGPTENGSAYFWTRADDASGTNAVLIVGAESIAYTLTLDDLGKFIRFSVVPTSYPLTGPTASSSFYGPIEAI